MFILPRYIVRQHIGPFFFGFFVITLLFILNLVFRELGRILSKGLNLWVVLEFFFLNLAWMIALAVPMAVLTATLMAFGRLSADNEITAIKASGISLYRIISPVLLIATGLAIFLIWFNNNVLPEFNHRAKNLYSDITRKRPTLNLEPGILYQELPQYNLMVQKIKAKENFSKVEGVLIYDKSDSRFNKTILAETGEIRTDEARGLFSITLYNGEMYEVEWEKLESFRRLKFTKHLLTISIPDMMLRRSDSDYRGDREKSAQVMLEEVKKNRQAIQKRWERINTLVLNSLKRYLLDSLVSTRTEMAPPPRPVIRPDEKTGQIWLEEFKRSGIENRSTPYSPALMRQSIQRVLRDHTALLRQIDSEMNIIDNFKRSNNILLVEIHKKYSIPVACIVFVLVGAPLGIMARRGNMAVSGGISLFFFLLYWAFLIAGEELADRQLLSPALAMWSPNILVGAAGIYLVIHSAKEVTSLRLDMLKIFVPKWLR